jgi:tellurite resistance protein TehA-like permease
MNKNCFLAQFVLGLVIALVAAYIMFHGSIFPENNSGIAIVLGIVGIGVIATSRIHTIRKKQ